MGPDGFPPAVTATQVLSYAYKSAPCGAFDESGHTYQNVSEAHLHRYLAEFDHRYTHRAKLGIDDAQRTAITVRGGKGKRLTYERTREA